jgi:hypothetical protein
LGQVLGEGNIVDARGVADVIIGTTLAELAVFQVVNAVQEADQTAI